MNSIKEELKEELLKAYYIKAEKAIKESDVHPVQCCENCFFCKSSHCDGQDEVIIPVKPFFTCKRWKERQDEKE